MQFVNGGSSSFLFFSKLQTLRIKDFFISPNKTAWTAGKFWSMPPLTKSGQMHHVTSLCWLESFIPRLFQLFYISSNTQHRSRQANIETQRDLSSQRVNQLSGRMFFIKTILKVASCKIFESWLPSKLPIEVWIPCHWACLCWGCLELFNL